MKNKINVIITGTTGMVGEGVLHECLMNPNIESIMVINRKSCGISNPKLKEIIHPDFFDLASIKDQLSGYDACFFCLGISSVGVNTEDYYKTTYTLTMHVAETVLNPRMTFCYISGEGTDSTEKGKIGWARVKGKTENDLMKLPFKQVFAFRPGFIKPTPGLLKTHNFYKYITWLFPLGRILYPAGFCTMQELALSMINAIIFSYPKKVITGKDIITLAKE
jgi:hypothetical protein